MKFLPSWNLHSSGGNSTLCSMSDGGKCYGEKWKMGYGAGRGYNLKWSAQSFVFNKVVFRGKIEFISFLNFGFISNCSSIVLEMEKCELLRGIFFLSLLH